MHELSIKKSKEHIFNKVIDQIATRHDVLKPVYEHWRKDATQTYPSTNNILKGKVGYFHSFETAHILSIEPENEIKYCLVKILSYNINKERDTYLNAMILVKKNKSESEILAFFQDYDEFCKLLQYEYARKESDPDYVIFHVTDPRMSGDNYSKVFQKLVFRGSKMQAEKNWVWMRNARNSCQYYTFPAVIENDYPYKIGDEIVLHEGINKSADSGYEADLYFENQK